MTAPQRLAQYVQPNLHEARLAHQWAKISNASRPRATFSLPRLVPVLAAALFFCGALAVGWRWFHALDSTRLNGMVVESNTAGAQIVTLPDGSRIELGSGSRLIVDAYDARKVQVSLHRGQAEFEVAPQTGRRFVVLAGKFEVSVIGTRFRVSLGPKSEADEVTVHVERGKVSVRNREATPDERVLGAGQTWSADEQASRTAVNNVDISSQSTNEPAAADESTIDEKAKSGSADNSVTASIPSTAKSPDAKELFEAAQLARINGNLKESADSLNRLRKMFRTDPRAGLAAFELGRMRMDTFGDISGSIDALRDAIRLSPNAPFREDAEARLVQLYSRRNDPKCTSAKEQYLQLYPNGAASKVVKRLCAP